MSSAETPQRIYHDDQDQASILRALVASKKSNPMRISGVRSIAVLSGKGGVGKTNLAVNLALALGEAGFHASVLDADLGLANVDVLFGVIPKRNLGHVLRGECSFDDILFPITDRVSIIPGGSGLRELADLDERQLPWIMERLSSMESHTDVLVIDTSAGIHRNVLVFAIAADQTLLLTTAEPTSIRDSYSVLKALTLSNEMGDAWDVGLVVNMAANELEAMSVAERVQAAAAHFLKLKIPYWGCVVWDRAVTSSVKQRKPFMLAEPDSKVAEEIRALADKMFESAAKNSDGIWSKGLNTFLLRLAKQMKERS